MNKKPNVTLEPALEEIAGEWSPAKRREIARVYARWARELRVSANAIDTQAAKSSRRRSQMSLPANKAKLN